MIPLTIGITILDEVARLARLEAEADAPLLLAALGTATGACIVMIIGPRAAIPQKI
jgi:hypothetical protein